MTQPTDRALEAAKKALPCEHLAESDEECHAKSCGACWYFDAVAQAIRAFGRDEAALAVTEERKRVLGLVDGVAHDDRCYSRERLDCGCGLAALRAAIEKT